MNTTQNRAKVLASFLRGAINDLGREAMVTGSVVHLPADLFVSGLKTIEDVAEELEQLATAPDPALPIATTTEVPS